MSNIVNDNHLKKIRDFPHLLGHLIRKTKLTQLHSGWIKKMWLSSEHISLQAHRGSYKTTAIVVVGIIFFLLFRPNTRIAVLRKKYTQSSEILDTVAKAFDLAEIRAIFEFAHKVAPSFITRKADKLVFSFKGTNTPEGNVDAYGIDSGITGKHYDIILADDIITMKDRYSKAERERVKAIISEIMTNIIEPSGHIIFTGTPWHKDDAWQMIPPPIKVDVYQSGILTEAEIEEKRKHSLNYSLFACNYELKHIADETAI